MTTVRAFSESINHVPIHFTALTPFGQTDEGDEGEGEAGGEEGRVREDKTNLLPEIVFVPVSAGRRLVRVRFAL